LQQSCASLTCWLPVRRRSPNSPRIPARIRPRSSVCCALFPLSKCSRPHPTVVSATRRSVKCCGVIILSRSARVPCFCPHAFFGFRLESSTNQSARASQPSNESSDSPSLRCLVERQPCCRSCPLEYFWVQSWHVLAILRATFCIGYFCPLAIFGLKVTVIASVAAWIGG
jgi:hypothetical protein